MRFSSKEEAQAFVDQYQTDQLCWVITFQAGWLCTERCVYSVADLHYFDAGWADVPAGTPVKIRILTAMTRPPNPEAVNVFSSEYSQAFNVTDEQLAAAADIPISEDGSFQMLERGDNLEAESRAIYQQMKFDYQKMKAKRDLTKED